MPLLYVALRGGYVRWLPPFLLLSAKSVDRHAVTFVHSSKNFYFAQSVCPNATVSIQVICHTGLPRDKRRATALIRAVKDRFGHLIHVRTVL